MLRWQTIVCPVDFSEVSLEALRLARSLAEVFGARIVLVHVVEPIVAPSDFSFGPLTSGDVEEQLAGRSMSSVEELVPGLGLPPERVKIRVERGRASTEVTRVAAEERADAIVMGTHGYTGMAHVLLGSTAERVLRKAPCPVLTVKSRQAEDEDEA